MEANNDFILPRNAANRFVFFVYQLLLKKPAWADTLFGSSVSSDTV